MLARLKGSGGGRSLMLNAHCDTVDVAGMAEPFSGEIRDGKPRKIISGPELGAPNGLLLQGEDLWVVTFASGELYKVTKDGKRDAVEKMPAGMLDGIVADKDGTLHVSSWEGKSVIRGKPGGEWSVVVKDVESPADIDYDPKRKRILIPGFNTNKLTTHQL